MIVAAAIFVARRRRNEESTRAAPAAARRRTRRICHLDQAIRAGRRGESPGKAAKHAAELCDADSGREPFRRESVHSEIDGAGEGEAGACARKQPFAFRLW